MQAFGLIVTFTSRLCFGCLSVSTETPEVLAKAKSVSGKDFDHILDNKNPNFHNEAMGRVCALRVISSF